MYKHTVHAKSSKSVDKPDLHAEVSTPLIADAITAGVDSPLYKALNAMITDSADIIVQRVMRAGGKAAAIVWERVGTNAKGYSDKRVAACNGLLAAKIAEGKATIADLYSAIDMLKSADYVGLEALHRKLVPEAFVKKAKKA